MGQKNLRRGFALQCIENKFYLAGGYVNGGCVSNIDVFVPGASDPWSAAESMQHSKYNPKLFLCQLPEERISLLSFKSK